MAKLSRPHPILYSARTRNKNTTRDGALLGLEAVLLGLGEHATRIRVRIRYGLDHIDHIVIYIYRI